MYCLTGKFWSIQNSLLLIWLTSSCLARAAYSCYTLLCFLQNSIAYLTNFAPSCPHHIQIHLNEENRRSLCLPCVSITVGNRPPKWAVPLYAIIRGGSISIFKSLAEKQHCFVRLFYLLLLPVPAYGLEVVFILLVAFEN